jgi:acetyl-CoA carboxylase biotin carboxyl carrier protein|tara:strand:- start:2052 stop:2522 length:471 start_codon:yes stop_codon:yes gene_type:complete
MWKDKIKEIIYMLENSDVNEIEVRFWFKKIKVTKKPSMLNVDSSQLSSEKLNVQNLNQEGSINKNIDVPKDDSLKNLIEIKSPMPGTFYSAPDPDSASFVNVGDNVNIGDTICIVEAMKIMNEIQAEESGTITEILVDNSNPVEFDQVLFKLKPSN